MPELPEVETTRLGLLSAVIGKRVSGVILRDWRLRWPIPRNLDALLVGRTVLGLARRGKYLLWDVESSHGGGFLLCHLGMSGSMFTVRNGVAPIKHDHVDIVLGGDTIVRYHDPRRFGAMLWISGATPTHPLLDQLGPEPMAADFNGSRLFARSRGRAISVKQFIMDGHTVVGVGNIYASESLFDAGIRPTTAAGRISETRYGSLASSIKATLAKAIAAGGSSLRDYVGADGESGYFQLAAQVYGREGEPCHTCRRPVRAIRQGQRSTFFCSRCQT